MLKREKNIPETPKKKPEKETKQNLFMRVLNRLLKLKFLKLLDLSIGFVKGFSVRLEFFEDKNNGDKK